MAITALAPKPLAQGQLPNPKGTLYTVPGATSTLFARGSLTNTDTNDLAINIYLKTAAGTSKKILSMTLAAGASVNVLIGGHIADAGGLLEGDAATASKVDYYFSGVEVT